MSTPLSIPGESADEFLPLRSKETRAKDAEAIRQEFLRSQNPAAASAGEAQSSTEENANEH